MSTDYIDSKTAVPIVFTNTVVYQRPKVTKRRKFVGVRRGLASLAFRVGIWAIEALESSFFEEEVETEEPGKVESEHFALVVNTDGEPSLDLIPVEHKPSCVHHYETVRAHVDRPIQSPKKPNIDISTYRNPSRTKEEIRRKVLREFA